MAPRASNTVSDAFPVHGNSRMRWDGRRQLGDGADAEVVGPVGHAGS